MLLLSLLIIYIDVNTFDAWCLESRNFRLLLLFVVCIVSCLTRLSNAIYIAIYFYVYGHMVNGEVFSLFLSPRLRSPLHTKDSNTLHYLNASSVLQFNVNELGLQKRAPRFHILFQARRIISSMEEERWDRNVRGERNEMRRAWGQREENRNELNDFIRFSFQLQPATTIQYCA